MNLSLVINIAAIITGIIGAIDIFIYEPSRRKAVRELTNAGEYEQAKAEQLLAEPAYVEYSKLLFPLLAIMALFFSFSESVNFSLVLVIASVVSGLIWLVDKILWEGGRKKALETLKASAQDIPEIFEDAVSKDPLLVEYSKAFFPIIFFILILRSFLFEPFKIPSGSMQPTLEVGDFVLVNKFAYGVRLPVIHKRVLDFGSPQRGDVFVFRFPGNPWESKQKQTEIDYIKRVIGLPGDRIIYKNRKLHIQPACKKGSEECLPLQAIDYKMIEKGGYLEEDSPKFLNSKLDIIEENLLGVKHKMLHDPSRSKYDIEAHFYQLCMKRQDEWIVPEGHYFAMGDNREHSADSRFWCFVPEENLVGKAVAIWMNWNSKNDYFINFSRLGSIQ